MDDSGRSSRGSPGETRRFKDARGIYAKWVPSLYDGKGGWSYYIQYYWNGKRVTEKVPAVRRDQLKAAKRFKAQREREKHLSDFEPSQVKKRREREESEQEADARSPLLFEEASARFLKECGKEYARADEVRRMFRNRLALAFNGRHLDEVNRVEIRRYYVDRLSNTGPFKKWKRKVGQRAPETEITLLSALYTFLQDEGHEIDNPCHRPRTRRKDGLLRPYKPAHEPVIPRKAKQRQAIFEACKKGKNGKRLISDEERVLWKLCFYTAARPESEPCRLLHGDVEFADGDRWGAVTYRNTKTGTNRRVLLHPEVERDLRAIMLPLPIDQVEREQWKRTPLFRKRGTRKAWDKGSYKKAWKHTIEVASKQHPELAGMWLRDFRAAAKSIMIDGEAEELVVNRILGHQGGIPGRYYRQSDKAMRRALRALTTYGDAVWDAGQGHPQRQSYTA